MPNWKPWMHGPVGLIKIGGRASALRDNTLIKVEYGM